MKMLRVGRWITAIGLVLLAGIYVRALAYTPIEASQGLAQKIFYLHVPAAIWAESAMILVGLASIFYLFTKDPRLDRFAAASAEVGAVFCAVVLTTGPIWGKPIWGTWWTWDARLTFTLFLFLLYVGYLLLRSAVTEPATRARFAAVLGICGMCEVPFIHLSVYMFPTLHPMPIVLQPGRPKLPGSMLETWALSLGVFTLLYVGFVVQRYARRGLRKLGRAVVQRAGGHGRVGALLERERLLERPECLVLAEYHLQRFAKQHPRVGVIGKADRGLPCRFDGAPAIVECAGKMHQRGVGIRETRRELAAEPQPGQRPSRGVALGGGSAARAETAECGAK